MVTTRRAAATASAEPSRASASTSPPPPPRRHLRSKQTTSPLKSLEDSKQTRPSASQPGVGKAAVSKTTTKRKRDAPQNSVAAASKTDVESASEAEEGIFFTENKRLRQENLDLRSVLGDVQARESFLNNENAALRRQVFELKREAMLRTGQGQANHDRIDMDMFGMTSTDASNVEDEPGLVGSAEAIALLRHIVEYKNPPRRPQPVVWNEPAPPRQAAQPAQGESPLGAAVITPSRPISKPGSFFSRSFSAIKSKLGLSTPTLPSPPVRTTSPPPPSTMTEVLSTPPTPIGQRSKALPKKRRQSPTLRLFLKGVEAGDLVKAEKWAKQAIADMKNRDDFEPRRHRLTTPILVEKLNHLPSSKPWESGFGDPLGHLDDEDTAPVWAVYLDMLAEEEEPKRKKAKASHEVSMGVDDTLSLDDMAATPKIHNSHGSTASLLDLHPRSSTEPSDMFFPSASHQEGSNVFNKSKGQDATAELQNTSKLPEKKMPTTPPKHNPSQGSYGLDYSSDDEDTSMFSENSALDGSTTPLWTQAPPPAPVPAHADLPGSETPSAATSQQPVHEIERQRQKLMKHTPAKPSRLREAFVPSPSILTEAGNASLASSLAAPGLFDDMPDAEGLDLTAEDWAAVEALRNTEEYKAADASVVWPDAHLTYDSDEETLSPE